MLKKIIIFTCGIALMIGSILFGGYYLYEKQKDVEVFEEVTLLDQAENYYELYVNANYDITEEMSDISDSEKFLLGTASEKITEEYLGNLVDTLAQVADCEATSEIKEDFKYNFLEFMKTIESDIEIVEETENTALVKYTIKYIDNGEFEEFTSEYSSQKFGEDILSLSNEDFLEITLEALIYGLNNASRTNEIEVTLEFTKEDGIWTTSNEECAKFTKVLN